jgi:diguanylate cyclase (GGDEF)-like protein
MFSIPSKPIARASLAAKAARDIEWQVNSMAVIWNHYLVVLSLLVPAFGAMSALSHADSMRASSGRAARLWMAAAAITLGASIWAMHFIGMLAFHIDTPLAYDGELTVLSVAPALGATLLAFHLLRDHALSHARVVAAGTVMGLGVAAMHYTGMAALKMQPMLSYDPVIFVLSLLLAVAASSGALLIVFAGGRNGAASWRQQCAASLAMALAIAGMHYTAIHGSSFAPGSICTVGGGSLDASLLAAIVAGCALLLFGAGALASAIDRRLALARLGEAYSRLEQQMEQRRLRDERIEYLANYDALTGLPNRNLLTSRLHLALVQAERSERSVGVLMLDIDRFKHINDSYGHAYGDALLREVAARLRSVPREGDTVGRLGGDEFVIVLANMRHPDNAAALALKVQNALLAPVIVEGNEIYVSVSLGVSVCPGDGDDADTLLKQADVAMYRAKDAGGNTLQCYTVEMGQRAMERVNLEHALYRALDNHEFELHYQPQVSLSTGHVTGVEALLRWRHPQLGLVSPARFIELAEETGLIVPIGEWVLRTACAQAAAWHREGYWPTMSVNVSARQLQQTMLVPMLRQVLHHTGLDPAYLELELTESMLIGDADATITVLRQLKQLGVSLALDDFGTGFSSLSYLTRFPIDIIKIDQCFVAGIPDRQEAASIVLAVIALAKALGQKTVAEGVETLAQLDFLDRNGCDVMQGYYFSRPLAAEAATALLERVTRLYPHQMRDIAATVRLLLG